MMGEQELSDRCREGDNLARKLLYEQYAGRMMAICMRYVGNRDVAQDLLHDGFVKIFSSFDRFAWWGEGSLRAWMERIVVNTVLQHYRRHDVMSQAAELDSLADRNEVADETEVDLVPQQVLMQFIEELPPGYRVVFNLYVFEEKSHKEIAALLGIQEKSSASQFFRAKSTLAKKIKEWIKNNG